METRLVAARDVLNWKQGDTHWAVRPSLSSKRREDDSLSFRCRVDLKQVKQTAALRREDT